LIKVGDLISFTSSGKYSGRVGLIMEVPYGLPRCAKIFWVDEGELGVAMFSNIELISEGG